MTMLGAGLTLMGVVLIILGVVTNAGYLTVVLGVLWLVMAAGWFLMALERRRRGQHGYYDQALPVPASDVRILAEQGRKIQAIKRYRQLNPDIGLREAKDVIDGLQPGREQSFPG
jgi:hypothetical protein